MQADLPIADLESAIASCSREQHRAVCVCVCVLLNTQAASSAGMVQTRKDELLEKKRK
jgi:hypothetical protein